MAERRTLPALGLAMGVVAFCLSLLPSLIPRPWVAQLVFTGVSVAIGYGVGVLVAWFGRRAGIRPAWSAQTQRIGWIVLATVSVVAVAVAMIVGAAWQGELRERFGMPGVSPLFVAVLPGALLVAAALVLVGRGIRALIHQARASAKQRLPTVAVNVASAIVAIAFAVLIFNGTIMAWVVAGLNGVAALAERANGPDIDPPTQAERSGSPDSLVSWDSLGVQGREFVVGGPTPDELAEFAGPAADPPAGAPIRVYAGLDSADELTEAAELVVDELDRTGAWERAAVVVITPTSSGYVEPVAADTIEAMYGGDTAIAAMQYSNVPSWMSFLSDRRTISEAGRALFDAVYAAWSELPEGERPLLFVQGESLGSYGGQGAFSGALDMTARTDGALWVATPSFTDTWRQLTDSRDDGSPQRHPIYDGGEQVRWSTGINSAADAWDLGSDWEHPRVLYVQNASDAVVWWSSDLIWHQPDWLREPRGADVLDETRWLPIVTFWLVTMDMFVAGTVPPGHGHVYLHEYADGWAAVAAPDDWTDQDTEALHRFVAGRFDR